MAGKRQSTVGASGPSYMGQCGRRRLSRTPGTGSPAPPSPLIRPYPPQYLALLLEQYLQPRLA